MEKEAIIELILSNQKRFYFSSAYDLPGLMYETFFSSILYQTIESLPILPELSSQIDKEIVKKSIFSTAAIEGNSLSEDEVGRIIDETSKADLMEKLNKEIVNLKNTYKLIDSLKDVIKPKYTNNLYRSFILTEKVICDIHYEITKDINYDGNSPGQYRNYKVKVGDSSHGGIYTPPYIREDISFLMKEFCTWINSEKITNLDPIIRAALAHYHLGIIHPFGDGNGRTARAIESLLLRSHGIKYVPSMLSNFYYKKMDDYYLVFSEAISSKDKDLTPFLRFILDGYKSSLQEIKDKIVTQIRSLTLSHYYNELKNKKEIIHRQYELLSVLLKTLSSFTFKQLFVESPYRALYKNVTERTARRDLQSLLQKRLIMKDNNDRYTINLKVLG